MRMQAVGERGKTDRAIHPHTDADRPLLAVVDDDESVGRAIVRLVRRVDMDAEAFVSGERFLARLDNAAFAPACVLLDVRMPGLSGLEVQKELTRRHVRCPVIVMTAYSDVDGHQRALDGGAIAVLFKPFDEQLLLSTIRTAIGTDIPGLADS
jgi:FixJ family two-component response regulator